MSKNTNTDGKGRGISKTDYPSDQCLCYRPRGFVLCKVCGYFTKGRIRYFCSIHPKTIFLCDINHCPRCRSHDFMMTEF